jgi:hypothetical protein
MNNTAPNVSVTQSSSKTLPDEQVRTIVREAAIANFGEGNFEDVRSATTTTDLDGNPALDITVVLTSGSSAAIAGAALNTLVRVHDELLREGDQRFPFIQYTTTEDLQALQAGAGDES